MLVLTRGRHSGQELKPNAYTLVDGGDGRWLVARPKDPLAIDREGCVRPVQEVLSSEEYSRISNVMYWLF